MDWVKDNVQQGLYKRMRLNDGVWAVKARPKGSKTPVTVTIGKDSLFSAQEARKKAREILAQLAQGINPNQQRKEKAIIEKARNLTLEEAITEFSMIASWKEKTRNDALSTLNRRFGDWYKRPLASITKEECQARFLKIKNDVASKKLKRDKKRKALNKPIKVYDNEVGVGEAQRAFRYLSSIFNSYIEDKAGQEKLLPNGNPCTILKAKKLRKALVPRERFLNDLERSRLYDTLALSSHEQYQGRITNDDADLVLLLIYTGLRLDEARTMLWSKVDLNLEEFTVLQTKNGRNHTLPMTQATKYIFLRRIKDKDSIYVFPSPLNPTNPTTASRTFRRICEEVGFQFSAHDLRRTVATVASEMGYDLNKIGAVLNHSKAGVTARYVQNTRAGKKAVLVAIQNALFPIPASDVKEN